jgi:Flp pilus assembly protein TadG
MSRPRPTWRWLRAALRPFGPASEAAAAVEFALVVPLMLTMYVGSIELSQAINVDQRVTTIAGTVGDLVARADGEIDASTLNDYFHAAEAIISPFSTTGLAQVVTVVRVDDEEQTTVLWSQGYNGGGAKTTGQPYPGPHAIPTPMLNISKNNYVIVSEASYSYRPLLGLFFKTPFALYHQNFYLPRYDDVICYNTAPPC